MLEELADLIDEAVTYMNPAERAPIYEEALDLLAELVIEIPTYQRKNLFVYDDSVIKHLHFSEVTLIGARCEIWEVELTANLIRLLNEFTNYFVKIQMNCLFEAWH
jgi:hypothetical protein